jgi:hypothetical protein
MMMTRRRMRLVPSSSEWLQRLLWTNKRWFVALLTLVVTSQWIVVFRFLPNHNNNDTDSPLVLLVPPNMLSGGGQSKQQPRQPPPLPRNKNQGILPPRLDNKNNNNNNNKYSLETTIQEAITVTWNGLPLTLVSSTTLPTSMIHCVGDNFLPNAWLYRSCQYRNLCFSSDDDDTTQTDGTFQLFVSDTQQQLQRRWNQWNHKYYARFSTNVNEAAATVSAIGSNPRWARKQKFQWHPEIEMIPAAPPPQQTMREEPILPRSDAAAADSDHQDHFYYRLPSKMVWIPIFVKPTTNPMSLLMDTLLPLFNLMAMFGWDDANENDNNNNTRSLLVTILNVQPSSPFQASTVTTTNWTKHDKGGDDDEEVCGQDCLQTMAQALSWMGAQVVTTNVVASPIPPVQRYSQQQQQQQQSFPTNQGIASSHNKTTRRRKRLICASQGAAGIGMLTDHGLSRHGLSAKDYSTIRNTGRGHLLYRFRNYILKHVLPQPQQQQPQQSTDRHQRTLSPPVTITVALNDEPATVTSTLVAQALQSGFQKIQDGNGHQRHQHHPLVTIQTLSLAPLEQHLDAPVIQKQAIKSQVWVTRAGDGSWPALFLPRDATLVLLYDEMETIKDGKKQQQQQQQRKPAMHHFDLWNHASHLKVHWFSIQSILKQHDDDKDSATSETDQYGGSGMKLLLDLLQDEIQGLLVVPHEQTDRVTTVGAADTLATFNGLDLRLVKESIPQDGDTGTTTSSSNNIRATSRAHCIGENWEWDAATYRSCHIQHLCMDVSQRPSPFVVLTSQFQDTLNATLQRMIATRPHSYYPTIATNLDTSVMVGQSIRLGTGEPWFPQPRRPPKSSGVVQDGQERSFLSYYALPDDTVWLPYYAEQPNANNPGHSLWDYFFPFYELVTMFGLDHQKLLLTNLDKWCVSYAPYPCWNVTTKFLPLLGVNPQTFFNAYNPKLRVDPSQQQQKTTTTTTMPQSNLVCARHGVAGMGMLTDHGYKKHGQLIDDYRTMHNVGKGSTFWDFRTFMLDQYRNSGTAMDWTTTQRHLFQPGREFPLIITVSINSSNNPSRRHDFGKQIKAMITSLTMADIGSDQVIVRTVVLGTLSLEKQLQIILESSIFISVIGGAVSTATFLKRNSCLILFFDDVNDFVKGAPPPPPPLALTGGSSVGDMPNMMDWDWWNNASYLRVHWLPIKTMDEEIDFQILATLIRNEIDIFTRLGDEKG